MKKLMLVVCLVSAFNLLEAQNAFRVGLTASPLMSWMSSQDQALESGGPGFGFTYGLLFDYSIGDNYALYSGIDITHTSTSLTYLASSTRFNVFPNDTFASGTVVDYRLQYIEIPLAFKLKTNEIGYITYYGQFGLDAAVNIKARGDFSTPNSVNDQTKVDLGKDVGPLNVGLFVGGGLEYNITGNTSLVTGLQYVGGFVDTTDNPKDYKTKATLSAVRLLIGVYF